MFLAESEPESPQPHLLLPVAVATCRDGNSSNKNPHFFFSLSEEILRNSSCQLTAFSKSPASAYAAASTVTLTASSQSLNSQAFVPSLIASFPSRNCSSEHVAWIHANDQPDDRFVGARSMASFKSATACPYSSIKYHASPRRR